MSFLTSSSPDPAFVAFTSLKKLPGYVNKYYLIVKLNLFKIKLILSQLFKILESVQK